MNGLITKNKRLKQDPGLYIINNRFETGVYIKYRVFPHKLSPDVQLQGDYPAPVQSGHVVYAAVCSTAHSYEIYDVSMTIPVSTFIII